MVHTAYVYATGSIAHLMTLLEQGGQHTETACGVLHELLRPPILLMPLGQEVLCSLLKMQVVAQLATHLRPQCGTGEDDAASLGVSSFSKHLEQCSISNNSICTQAFDQ